jgi:uncharacterized protein (TIGR02172 family)
MIGTLIGKGNTADVYEMDNNKVIKLFNTGYPLDDVRSEFENSKLVNMLDVSIVKSYELVSYNGRYGIIYERIDGESMLDLACNAKDFEKYAITLALLHKKILSRKLQSAVSLKLILKKSIVDTDKLSMQCKSKLIKTLEALPDGDCFCHGDFHFGNIIVSQENYFVIDYMNVCRGHEYGDIARTVYYIEMTPVPPEFHDEERILYIKKRATDIYLKEMGVTKECLSDWLMIINAARLSELSDEQTKEKTTILEYLAACGL